MNFYILFTVDQVNYKLLGADSEDIGGGTQAEILTAAQQSIWKASKNHGQDGRYVAIAETGILAKNATFDKTPILTD